MIGLYDGQQPFHHFIKQFFSLHKKYGSRDRKQIAQLCYGYFRLGLWAKNKPVEEAIPIALFLCTDQPHPLLAALHPVWNEKHAAGIQEKITLAGITAESFAIFPFSEELSEDIAIGDFNLSHLQQPDVFIRVRPGFLQAVIRKLQQEKIHYAQNGDHCLALSPAVKINELFSVNKEVVIQDYNSQRTGKWIQWVADRVMQPRSWDCCAASGGKSIMAKDILGNIDLTVSDIRPSVLTNLRKRFSEAGIDRYTLLQADLSKPFTGLQQRFQFIIADAPCTGSGTWGRTPERLLYCKKEEITRYQLLQQQIVSNAIDALQPGGYFLYITCSVFKKENEDMVRFMQEELNVHLEGMELLKGYDKKADTMFTALFRKL